MQFVQVAKVADIPEGSKKNVIANGYIILLTNVAGTFYALAGNCPHKGGALCHGILEGTTIKCPTHGMQFDLTTGREIHQPKTHVGTQNKKSIKSYNVDVRGAEVFVAL
jgi:nitrite reductase/ring-hydroxylating ferredoxin subunit